MRTVIVARRDRDRQHSPVVVSSFDFVAKVGGSYRRLGLSPFSIVEKRAKDSNRKGR